MKQIFAAILILTAAIGCNAQTNKNAPASKQYEITKTDAEWHKQLNALQFDITRKKGTEAAYSGKYWDNHQTGVYSCVCCGLPLFSSATKFESGTGWPSFWMPLDKKNVEEIQDNSFGMMRTEINCRRCGAHLGHVFDDGPKPTGLRYCMNSASLSFIKK